MATIKGNAGDNTLRGTSGADTLLGLAGDDRLFGLAGDDLLQGDQGRDRLEGGDGNDRLDGGSGADRMLGGQGNDTYVVDNGGDRIVEEASQGIDTVESFITYTLGANLENLTLVGTRSVDGTGNRYNNIIIGNIGNNVLRGLAGNDRLDGNAGDDTLNGGPGDDYMIGGTGNDTYVVNSIGDRVYEAPDQGNSDTVTSSIDFTLPDNFENLTLLGQATTGIGNSLPNTMVGNAASNILRGQGGADDLNGGGGNDTLIGGGDVDLFIYQTGRAFTNADIGRDTIVDFAPRTDAVVLSKQTFDLNSAIGFGFTIAGEFASVATDKDAETSNAVIVFSRATSTLFYNPNGASSGFGLGDASGSFIIFNGSINLSATDFVIQA
jgi:Ca2+-binding RTX toxin-like protein